MLLSVLQQMRVDAFDEQTRRFLDCKQNNKAIDASVIAIVTNPEPPSFVIQ